MKTIFLLTALFTGVTLFAQTREVYGKFTKSDGSKIKGSSVRKMYEDQLIITNYTGGSDNTGIIEIETSTGAYVAEFRNVMNAAGAAAQPVLPKPKTAVAATTVRSNIDIGKTQIVAPSPAQVKITRGEISVVSNNPGQSPQYLITTKIVMEDLQVISCTDDAVTGKSKIKLKGTRIGWIYYTYDNKGNATSSKAGWDTATGQAWTNF